MLAFLKRLFRREEAPPPGSLVQELWVAELSHARRGRFLEVREEAYTARYAEGGLELELRRPDLFAWTEAPPYRYSDFVMEGEFEFGRRAGAGAPYSSCGLLFRYQDDADFYSLLVSNKGFFRLDVVFNGSPRPLVAWTELPSAPGEAEQGEAAAGRDSFSLRLIARGSHFTVIVDELWAAEAVDESFRSGYIAFAGQNYGEGDAARFSLKALFVESRSLEVETWYYRWNYYVVPDSGARRALAETFFSMGEHLAAAVQLRKIERRRPLDVRELFLKAETALRLGLQDEAAAALDACLALDPAQREAIEEKANLLYLRGRSLELRDWLVSLGPSMEESARLSGLSGHARFALGDFAGAAIEYRRAAELDPQQALFRMNEARAWDQAGRRAEAAAAYLGAARLFFAQDADDDLALALGRLAVLRPRSPEHREIRAKLLFRQGKKEEAAKLLSALARSGSEDSAVHYLLGILQAERGRREDALVSFTRALGLEPDYPLYAFRYAEALFLAGRDCGAELDRALKRALELAPGDGWTLNLAGQAALARGDRAEARSRLQAARAALPRAPEPAMNLAELESREGMLEAALATLAPFPESAACRNLAGNALSREAEGDGASPKRAELLERAAREYERAAALEPGRAEYQENLAAAYLELERYSDAEKVIRKALDRSSQGGPGGRPSPRACLLAGNLAAIYGDRPRAEAAYRLGLETEPRDAALLAALGRHYLGERNYKKARGCADALRALSKREAEPGPDGEESALRSAERLESEIEEATTEGLSCASCGRRWRVPRELPAQSGANIRAMPPDYVPAGTCPSCGAIYCIACRKAELVGSRFTCPRCGEPLKLSDNRLRWLVREGLRREAGR